MKVIIPVAGAGTRLRPHTYTQPKPLIPVAGKPIISYTIDKLVERGLTDIVLVIGYLGDKIREFIREAYPNLRVEYAFQEFPEGSGHALWVARELLEDEDEVLIAFGDTIFDFDFGPILDCPHSCLGVKKVGDPREFGVAECDEHGMVRQLVEKPRIPKSNMALVGIYKVREVPALLRATDYLVKNDERTFGEIQLTDALQYMVSKGVPFQSIPVSNWYDCGRKGVLLETNAMLLNQAAYASDAFNLPEFDSTIIIHPVSIASDCQISNSIIGPHVTIGRQASVSHCIIKDSIIGNDVNLQDVVLHHSVIGSDASVKGANLSLNIGDNTEIDLG
jgi:glucose-1-phosphate thymidylyltransferase